MKQVALCGGFAFDPLSFQPDAISASEVDDGGRQIAEALMGSAVVVIIDGGRDLPLEIACQAVDFRRMRLSTYGSSIARRIWLTCLNMFAKESVIRRGSLTSDKVFKIPQLLPGNKVSKLNGKHTALTRLLLAKRRTLC